MFRSLDMVVKAGATMEEETGEMNVNNDTVTTIAHFFFMVQFLGFPGSSGPSHVTCRVVNILIVNRTTVVYLQAWDQVVDPNKLS